MKLQKNLACGSRPTATRAGSNPQHPKPGWIRSLSGAALGAAVALLAAGPSAAVDLSCMRIAELIPHYLQKHVRYHYPNDELRKRVVDSYMRRLDPAKTLFLREEAEALSSQLQSVLLDVNDGDCETLAHIHADIPKRYEAMEKYIISYVERDDYEIDPNATLVIDSEKRPRPSTREEQHELYQSCLLYTSPSPRDKRQSRMPSSA